MIKDKVFPPREGKGVKKPEWEQRLKNVNDLYYSKAKITKLLNDTGKVKSKAKSVPVKKTKKLETKKVESKKAKSAEPKTPTEKEPYEPYKTYDFSTDHTYIQQNLGKLVKVTDTEYIPLKSLNDQDLEDIRQIKGLEKIADVRRK